jgi:hypothetical protein
MIIVRVELWPGGDANRARLLGLGKIENVGNGSDARGNYAAALVGATSAGVTPAVAARPPFRSVRVEGFPRQQLCAWDLLFRVLREAIGDRNL